MKTKWKDEEIVKLFNIVSSNNKKNICTLQSFKQYANNTGRNALSVRNFYYTYLKILKDNPSLQKKLGIDISQHYVQTFEHFNKQQEEELKNEFIKLKSQGISTRNACMKLSNGDIKQMLRIQNKLRNMNIKGKINKKQSTPLMTFQTKKENESYNENTQVIKFPNQNQSKTKLSDDDIKSLFMGLVKLVKENANSDSHEKAEQYLKQTEEEKRKRIIELEQKQFEIDRLHQELNELKYKNTILNKQLENYRINFVSNTNKNNFEKA